ncbi:replication protein RepA, partial [Corynebacterium mastitidis]|uniref:replication protein RepA n=1 Tax=Corynebacterium mastitidis TaxID=161890 RepID=UPI001FCFB58E
MKHTRSHTVGKSADSGALTSEVEVGYTTRVLVQALFPYRKPQDDKIVARAGNTQITIYSPDGLPYGKYPRLIMAYLITQAVLRKGLPEDEARRIPLGSSMNEFMELMGLSMRGNGGPRGTIGILREQLNRLATSSITVRKIYDKGTDRDSLSNVSIVDEMDVWFSHDPDQATVEG